MELRGKKECSALQNQCALTWGSKTNIIRDQNVFYYMLIEVRICLSLLCSSPTHLTPSSGSLAVFSSSPDLRMLQDCRAWHLVLVTLSQSMIKTNSSVFCIHGFNDNCNSPNCLQVHTDLLPVEQVHLGNSAHPTKLLIFSTLVVCNLFSLNLSIPLK